jgi:hypothetical protein
MNIDLRVRIHPAGQEQEGDTDFKSLKDFFRQD